MGIPAAASILNVVIITAAISALNADVYGAYRMMYGTGEAEPGAGFFREGYEERCALDDHPHHGAGYGGRCDRERALRERVRGGRLLATFATVFVWVMILLAHIAFKRSGADTEAQPVRQPLWLSYLALAFMIFIVVLFGCFADTQLALVMGALWCLFLLGYYRLVVVRARSEA